MTALVQTNFRFCTSFCFWL